MLRTFSIGKSARLDGDSSNSDGNKDMTRMEMEKDALAIKLPLYLSSLALWARIWEISFHPPNRITIWLMEISQNSYRNLTEIEQN